MTASESQPCMLCGSPSGLARQFRGHFSEDGLRVSFVRFFFRCSGPACSSVFYKDRTEVVEDDLLWDAARQRAELEMAHRQDTVEVPPVKAPQAVKRQYAAALAADKALYQSRLRRLRWEYVDMMEAWLSEHDLPDSFALKEPGKDTGLYQPKELWASRGQQRSHHAPTTASLHLDVGDIVSHKTWGRGVVISASAEAGVVDVEFSTVGTKRLDVRLAPLTRVTRYSDVQMPGQAHVTHGGSRAAPNESSA